jgi:DNA mismatch repair protein MutS2
MAHDPATLGLDWPVVRDALARHSHTSMGADAVAALPPCADRQEVARCHDEVHEWLTLAAEGIDVGVGGVADIREGLRRAGKGEVLEGHELLAIGRTLRALTRIEHTLDLHEELAPTLAQRASVIYIDPLLIDELEESFEPTGELSIRRYPELADLRKAIASLHTQVRSTLDGLVKGDTLGDLLQDSFWTVRDNRYVLPIKSHAKRWDLGIVHDTSGSGQTVFVEPHAVIELNNRLRLAEGKLKAAEHRILATLSRQLAQEVPAARDALSVAVSLDLVAARAGLATALRATRPSVGREGRLELIAARHPVLVLRGIEVVANDLSLGPDQPVLVLSGPNAGGKTVALKTLGLCALLVRYGCYVPAAEGSRVDLFDDVATAVGDQQTVEGDLSSFSAHLVTLRQMVDEAGAHQLVLLDEVASGTDPAQGAAIAQAVLEHLADGGARVVVTTHFAPLKGLAAADPRFGVAAVQYAEGAPTYRVLMGATGESHALSTAQRVGLPEPLLARAREILGAAGVQLTQTLEALEAQRGDLDLAEQRARQAADDLAAREREVARREADLKRRIKQLEAKGAKAYLDRLASAEKAIAQVVAQLQAAPSHKGVAAAKATVAALQGLAPASESAPATSESPVDEAPLTPGDRVKLRKIGKVGEVVSVGSGGVQVRAGGLTVNAKRRDLERIGGPLAPEPPKPSMASVSMEPRDDRMADAARHGGNTLDLRGKRVDEAIGEVELFFDRMVMRGQDTVFLLHGHGTGALKEALRSELRGNAYVKDWAPASEEQGGDAFTVCVLS